MVRELTNVIQSTKDYRKFSLLNANRTIQKNHVNDLVKAIEETGNFTEAQPILVNEKLEVIDGQHRLQACKQLDLPIFYTAVSGLGIREARNINILHATWKPIDFATSYAKQGNKVYQEYLRFIEEYGFYHTIISIYMNNGWGQGIMKIFRKGELEINLPMEDLEKYFSQLDDIRDTLQIPIPRVIGVAFLKIFKSGNYDHSRMIRKLQLYGSNLESFSRLEDTLRQLEEIYNFKQAEATRTRLY